MAQYGTIEFYRESIDEEKIQKEILLNALQNVARECKDLHLTELIAEKISQVNNSLKWKQAELERLLEEQNKNSEVE